MSSGGLVSRTDPSACLRRTFLSRRPLRHRQSAQIDASLAARTSCRQGSLILVGYGLVTETPAASHGVRVRSCVFESVAQCARTRVGKHGPVTQVTVLAVVSDKHRVL